MSHGLHISRAESAVGSDSFLLQSDVDRRLSALSRHHNYIRNNRYYDSLECNVLRNYELLQSVCIVSRRAIAEALYQNSTGCFTICAFFGREITHICVNVFRVAASLDYLHCACFRKFVSINLRISGQRVLLDSIERKRKPDSCVPVLGSKLLNIHVGHENKIVHDVNVNKFVCLFFSVAMG